MRTSLRLCGAVILMQMGCGSGSRVLEKYSIPQHDEFFDQYLEAVNDDYREYGIPGAIEGLSMSFGSLPDTTFVGCWSYTVETFYLSVNSRYEKRFREEPQTEAARMYRDILQKDLYTSIHHELGHCLHQLDHDDSIHLLKENIIRKDTSKDLFGRSDVYGEERIYIPASLMYPKVIPYTTFARHKSYYMQKMKDPHHVPEGLVETLPGMADEKGKALKPEYLKLYVVFAIDGSEIKRTRSEAEYLQALSSFPW